MPGVNRTWIYRCVRGDVAGPRNAFAGTVLDANRQHEFPNHLVHYWIRVVRCGDHITDQAKGLTSTGVAKLTREPTGQNRLQDPMAAGTVAPRREWAFVAVPIEFLLNC
jgi:hypothetical protein